EWAGGARSAPSGQHGAERSAEHEVRARREADPGAALAATGAPPNDETTSCRAPPGLRDRSPGPGEASGRGAGPGCGTAGSQVLWRFAQMGEARLLEGSGLLGGCLDQAMLDQAMMGAMTRATMLISLMRMFSA